MVTIGAWSSFADERDVTGRFSTPLRPCVNGASHMRKPVLMRSTISHARYVGGSNLVSWDFLLPFRPVGLFARALTAQSSLSGLHSSYSFEGVFLPGWASSVIS